MSNHLFRNRLRRHQHARDIDREHGIGVFGAVLERRRLLLDTRGREQGIHPALGVADVGNNLVHARLVAHVDLAVVQRGAQLLGRAALEDVEFWAGFREAVEGVDWSVLEGCGVMNLGLLSVAVTHLLRRLRAGLRLLLDLDPVLRLLRGRLCRSWRIRACALLCP